MPRYEYSHCGACRELVWITTFYRNKTSARHARELAKKLCSFYDVYGAAMLESFARILDTKLIFPASAMELLRPSMVARKAALYSGVSLCVLPCVLSGSRVRLSASARFVDFVISCHSAIRAGKLIPFPLISTDSSYHKQSWYSEHRHQSGSVYSIERKLDEHRIDSYAAKSDSLAIFGAKEQLLSQINEDCHEPNLSHAGMQRLFLPTLKGIDLDTLLEVMSDNDDPTYRFRHALHEMIASTDQRLGDTVLFRAMDRIDLEVRNLTETMRRISKDRALRIFETSVGCTTVALSFIVPEWLSHAGTQVFGSLTAVDGLRNIIAMSNAKGEVARSEFYLPWLLTREA